MVVQENHILKIQGSKVHENNIDHNIVLQITIKSKTIIITILDSKITPDSNIHKKIIGLNCIIGILDQVQLNYISNNHSKQ